MHLRPEQRGWRGVRGDAAAHAGAVLLEEGAARQLRRHRRLRQVVRRPRDHGVGLRSGNMFTSIPSNQNQYRIKNQWPKRALGCVIRNNFCTNDFERPPVADDVPPERGVDLHVVVLVTPPEGVVLRGYSRGRGGRRQREVGHGGGGAEVALAVEVAAAGRPHRRLGGVRGQEVRVLGSAGPEGPECSQVQWIGKSRWL